MLLLLDSVCGRAGSMNSMDKTLDYLAGYALGLRYEDLPSEVVHAVKRTLVDTLGCAIGAHDEEPVKIGRKLAANVSSALPAHVLGTGTMTSPDMAGFANGVAVRYLDC